MGGFDLDTIALGAAAAATVLAAIGALPQVRLVVRTGDVRGVSFSMVTLGAAVGGRLVRPLRQPRTMGCGPGVVRHRRGVRRARRGPGPSRVATAPAGGDRRLLGGRADRLTVLDRAGSAGGPARGDRGRPGHSAGLDRVADQTPNRRLVDRCGRSPSSRPPCGPASAWFTATPRSCSSAPSGRRLGSPCSSE